VQVELLAPRTLGLIGPVLAEDADRLLEGIASLAPGGPIILNLTEVTSIDEGGIVAIRRAATITHDIGGVLVLLLPPTETLDQIRGGGLDEEPMILVEVLEIKNESQLDSGRHKAGPLWSLFVTGPAAMAR